MFLCPSALGFLGSFLWLLTLWQLAGTFPLEPEQKNTSVFLALAFLGLWAGFKVAWKAYRFLERSQATGANRYPCKGQDTPENCL